MDDPAGEAGGDFGAGEQVAASRERRWYRRGVEGRVALPLEMDLGGCEGWLHC